MTFSDFECIDSEWWSLNGYIHHLKVLWFLNKIHLDHRWLARDFKLKKKDNYTKSNYSVIRLHLMLVESVLWRLSIPGRMYVRLPASLPAAEAGGREGRRTGGRVRRVAKCGLFENNKLASVSAQGLNRISPPPTSLPSGRGGRADGRGQGGPQLSWNGTIQMWSLRINFVVCVKCVCSLGAREF